MFTHVMNLTMNAAIFRPGPVGAVPRRTVPSRVRAAPRRAQERPRSGGEKGVPATLRIYADAFKTAVYGG
jgi:hypothetical protein